MSELDPKIERKFNIEMANLNEDVKRLNESVRSVFKTTEESIKNNTPALLANKINKLSRLTDTVSEEYEAKFNRLPEKLKAKFLEEDLTLIQTSEILIDRLFEKHKETQYERKYSKEIITAFIVSNLLTFSISLMVAYSYLG